MGAFSVQHKLVELNNRRQWLIQKAAMQRATLAQNMEPLRKPLNMVDRSLQVVRYFKKHPALMLAITALSGSVFLKIRLARFNALLQTGWSAFQLMRTVRQSLHKD